jgi:hypothetical protein
MARSGALKLSGGNGTPSFRIRLEVSINLFDYM